MKYLFFDTYEQAQQRCDKAFEDMNCSDPNTTAYATPEKHPEKEIYAVCIDESFLYLFTELELETAQEKTDDWIIKLEMK